MIRVALVDDEPLVRAGLRTILESEPQIRVVAEADSGAGAVDLADRYRPDVLLLDIQMPGGNGLTAAEALRERHPGMRVVIVTTFNEDRYVARALDAGVDGFVLKSADPYELIAAVKAAWLCPRRWPAGWWPRCAAAICDAGRPPGQASRR